MSRVLLHSLFIAIIGGCCISTLSAQSTPTPSPSPTPTPEKDAKLQTLKGDFILGTVELRDDYTLRVTSESGIMNIPIAALNEAGFKKYGFQKNRSQDGRFWSERKDALETAKTDDAQTANKNAESPQKLEISLSEIAPFQPFIEAYQKTVQDQKAADATTAAQKADADRLSTKNSDLPNLFSNPAQAAKTLSAAVSSIPNAVPALPGVPSVPGVPTSIPSVPASLPTAP